MQHSTLQFFIDYTNLSRKVKTILTISNANPETCVGTYLYSAVIQHGNLHQLSVKTSRMTYFIMWATQQPVLVTAKTGERGDAGDSTWRVEMNKDQIPSSKRSIQGYLLTYFRLYRENLGALVSQQMEP